MFLMSRRYVFTTFSALKLWLICNYVLYCIQIWNQCSKWGKAMWIEINGTVGGRVGGGECVCVWGGFVQFLLRILPCFVMQSIRNGPKKPFFHLPYLQLHSLDWELQQKAFIMLNYWEMAICWVYELLLVHRIWKGVKTNTMEMALELKSFVSCFRASSYVLVCDQ